MIHPDAIASEFLAEDLAALAWLKVLAVDRLSEIADHYADHIRSLKGRIGDHPDVGALSAFRVAVLAEIDARRKRVVEFTCHGNNAPAYGCSKPGDRSGNYVKVAP